jgi:hypothetical protein
VLPDEPSEAKVEPVGGFPDDGALDEMPLRDPADATPREARARSTPALVEPPETPAGKPT